MIYEIQGNIITDNEGIRNSVFVKLPSEDNPQFHSGTGASYLFSDFVNDDGIKQINFRYIYSTEDHRNGAYSSIHGLEGIVTACEDDSFVWKFGCNHDTEPSIPCVSQGGIRK